MQNPREMKVFSVERQTLSVHNMNLLDIHPYFLFGDAYLLAEASQTGNTIDYDL